MSNTRQANTSSRWRAPLLFLALAVLFVLEGTVRNAMFSGSWNTALGILNMGLISAITALGVNMQWGYAGLFNVGVVGFLALGGLAPVLVATAPVDGAWQAGGPRILLGLALGIGTLALAAQAWKRMARGRLRGLVLLAILIAGFIAYRAIFDPAVIAIEANNPARHGNIGGLGLPVLLSWAVGGVFAAAAAWAVGKVALGLRSDYLAIATLGIGEIIVAVLKNEDWLARGVKNVTSIPRPVAYEIDLQQNPAFQSFANRLSMSAAEASGIWVKISYLSLFLVVLLVVILLAELALKSPWGRMMRAIRDNETAAEAMGKDVTARHLQVFVLGSAVIGIAGAMMITQDGLMAPVGYNPLRYTFLIWVMVIVGGSGNNWGAVLGAVLIWFLWIKAEVWGPALMGLLVLPLPDGGLKAHLLDSSAQMRFIAMGLVLLLVLRFAPRGLVPER
ncbi:MAG: branched-chain amino acid ABC transporter permease [Paracoccus sp. (in: a-proteobacteria)]|jgi:branched-chain amino acid transport system permease protein|uniref:branched-chain amino acid ABC transporter permease n=2 Tax=Paracoccus TaxID=265 RepID=UPI000C53664E|nr:MULTISPECIES: branched-chain amino acid ABC transporter permease [unclassified Paracoccus (in: a-proteobacteria)]MAN55383.1 branched-chain amino acid ABC transporter permease [Paracoccus sp. (in: a-proteobacteria)]MCS5601942.1 branched-chain amino acid ABC transporter permease [Paracoccus sp. (in: a-proteobacteria)]MDB2490650.1 branched-chain amino acid ABC transporter permease [Paracoccus sp. (in: a-proteobacteria)]MDB2552260.1 branched-chain amino acid ABC transporter permease [Paracoccus |tara:strand:+ start:2842 stop:4185 length:1344 start_codon:yes stop_codon:yes gene_type:complete